MTAAELLQGLKARGATAAANGDRLKLSAPPGVLSPRVLDFAAKHKAELLQLLDLETKSRAPNPPRRELYAITSKAAPCVSCGAYCGEAALCAFCCREALA